MAGRIDALVVGAEGMAKVLGELADGLMGCTENSPEEVRLRKIMDALDAYTVARDALEG